MFTLQCLCKFRDRWTDLDGVNPYATLGEALTAAAVIAANRGTPVRIQDDWGNVYY